VKNFWENDLLPGYYDLIVRQGTEKNRGIQTCWHVLTYSKVCSFVEESMDHLDYACGPGTLIGRYTKARSIGVDLSHNQIDYAVQNYHHSGDFIPLDNFHFRENQDSFDVITALGLFEYLSDEEILNLLDEFYFMLKENGKIIITTPNYGGLMYVLDKVLNLIGPVDYGLQNINKFSKKRLIKLINKTKFKSYKVTKFNTLFLFLSFINLNLGKKINNFIENITKNKFGLLMLLEITK
tara:strand:- start:162 stop:875 length:714 start_codon:yes stop_codon:yes gene_type:complete